MASNRNKSITAAEDAAARAARAAKTVSTKAKVAKKTAAKPSGMVVDNDTIEALKAEIAQLKANAPAIGPAASPQRSPPSPATSSSAQSHGAAPPSPSAPYSPPGSSDETPSKGVRYEKPPGEAGKKKNGYTLRSAMGLDLHQAIYEAIRSSIPSLVTRAGINANVSYSKQELDAVTKFFRLSRLTHEYLRDNTFPNNWPAADFLKQYLHNHTNHNKRKGKKMAAESKATNVDEEDDEEPQDDDLYQ